MMTIPIVALLIMAIPITGYYDNRDYGDADCADADYGDTDYDDADYGRCRLL